GFDFIVPDYTGERYVIIEANERPGLANHEPQPTAERFIDFLFPETKEEAKERAGGQGVHRIETIVKKATIPARCIGRKPPCTTGPIPLISQAVLKVHSHMRESVHDQRHETAKPATTCKKPAGARFGRAHLAVARTGGFLLAPVPPFLEG